MLDFGFRKPGRSISCFSSEIIDFPNPKLDNFASSKNQILYTKSSPIALVHQSLQRIPLC